MRKIFETKFAKNSSLQTVPELEAYIFSDPIGAQYFFTVQECIGACADAFCIFGT